MSQKFKLVSFFSGGGLLDYSFKEDFEIIWANELYGQPALSYIHNIGNHIAVGDIAEISIASIPKGDLVYLGGPPCLDFSSDGKNRGEIGKTGHLVLKYQDIILENRPAAFMLENVANLAQQHKGTLHRLLGSFSDAYNMSFRIVDAADFGVPQSRKRLVLVGIRKDLGFYYQFSHPPYKKASVREAIGDLPEAATNTKYVCEAPSVPNHTTNWASPSPERLHDVIINPRRQRRGMRRLEWDALSPTLTAHIAKDGREFLHPVSDRRITVREALRIMSFPDSFVIPETVKLSHQYRLVGNGVPYLLGKELAFSLRNQLEMMI